MKRRNKTNALIDENLVLSTYVSKVQSDQMIPVLPFVGVSKEFFPYWIKQKLGKHKCPICKRPDYKEPGPFNYGITLNKNDKTVSLWVQSFGCCKTTQNFPYQFIKEQNLNSENIVPILKKVFSLK